LGTGVKEAARHLLDGDIVADALDVEPDAADIAGYGDEGEVIARGDGDAQPGRWAGEEAGKMARGFRAGVAAEDVIAEEGGLEAVGAVAGDGAVVLHVPPRLLETGAPDVQLVYGEFGMFRGGEP